MSATVLEGDALATLATLPAEVFQCCVTSPPYYRLRDYGVEGQMGLEESPEAFIAGMVSVFREVRRVLRDDGTLWLNIGDSYAGPNNGYSGDSRPSNATSLSRGSEGQRGCGQVRKMGPGLKTKDLIGIPWMLAFALRADGWYLRADIIWHKPNPMPESIKDRPTKAHEYVFLLTKQPRYFYDADAIAEGVAEATVVRMAQNVEAQRGSDRAHAGAKTNGPMKARVRGVDKQRGHSRRHAGFNDRWDAMSKDGQASMGRNSRSVWSIATEPFSGAHFATMPTELARRCIAAGSSERGQCPHCGAPWVRVIGKGEPDPEWQERCGADASGGYAGQSTKGHDDAGVQNASDVKRRILAGLGTKKFLGWRPSCACPPHEPVPQHVLDPFGGAGTTALVAERLKRDATIIELNPEYAEMARARIIADAPLLAEVA